MKYISALVFFFLLVVAPVNEAVASLQNENSHLLKIRASKHTEFHRIVLEGPNALIDIGKVNQEGKNIVVRFSGADFIVENGKINISYQIDKDTIIFELKEPGDMKVFPLNTPSRLVIDVFKKEQNTQKSRAGNDIKQEENIASSGRTASASVNNNLPEVSNQSRTIRSEKEVNKTQTLISKTTTYNSEVRPSLSFFATKAEASTIQQGSNGTEARKPDGTSVDSGFIHEKFRKTWEILTKDKNPFKVISELSAIKPVDSESLASYHFILGEAYDAAKRYLEAIDHLRLAYIYASNEKLKELAFFRRAEVYTKLGFFYEARSNYSVFIKDFPTSTYISKAYLGLANSLSETGSFDEAVEHYKKAGNSPEVLFNMANALQKLERTDDARKIYMNAMNNDSSYPGKSPETYYFFAENMRMSGQLNEAKKLLSAIESGPFRDSARISLGLIAMDESNMKEAIEYFRSISYSRNIKIKVNALFNLSLAYLKAGKMKESISTLEDIRKNYHDSSMYDEALLVLSKLYRQEGKIKESVSLLKELVYGKKPPKEAFTELEEILIEANGKTDPAKEGEVRFTDLWREVGQWLLDETRGEFLLKIARKLKPEGKPFLQLCSWLAENASGNVKITAAIDLADYYSDLENVKAAEKYLTIVKETTKELKVKDANDVMNRIEARINHINKKNEAALINLISVKDFDNRDFELLGRIIKNLKQSGSSLQQAIAFYERSINRTGGEAEDYTRLGDILFDYNEEKALAYYRTAHEKNPKDEWTIYRIGLIVDMPETSEMLSKLGNGDSLISRVAKAKLKEIDLLNKIEEVYQ